MKPSYLSFVYLVVPEKLMLMEENFLAFSGDDEPVVLARAEPFHPASLLG